MAQISIQENYYILLLLPILFFVPLFYLILKQIKSFTGRPKNVLPLPPGPSPWPILGNLTQIGTFSPATLEKLSRNYGPLMLLRLGNQNMVVASSPAAATEILKTHDRNLSARAIPEAVRPGLLESDNRASVTWSETCDTMWKSLRTMWRANLFSTTSLDAQSCLKERKLKELIEYLKGKQGEVVGIGDLVVTTMFNIFGHIVFSKDLIGLDEENSDDGIKHVLRSTMETITSPNISDFYKSLSKFDLQGKLKKMLMLNGKFDALWASIIQERRRGSKNGDASSSSLSSSQKDFLDFLIHNNFSDARINQFVMELLLAGIDTTSAAIEWALAELIKHPKSMKKVVEEVDQVFLNKLDTNSTSFYKESTLMKLPYLQACIKETLRLHPSVPMLLHRANESCILMDYTIPQNATVVVNLWAVLRDAATWDEPLLFKPERFLNSDADFIGNDEGYIPFGGGRRFCPGFPLAIRSVPLFIATLVHTFDWSVPQGKDLDMKETFGLTTKKEQPLLLIPLLRK